MEPNYLANCTFSLWDSSLDVISSGPGALSASISHQLIPLADRLSDVSSRSISKSVRYIESFVPQPSLGCSIDGSEVALPSS